MGMVCEDCASKPDPELAKKATDNPDWLIGKYAKLGFPAPGLGVGKKEHMWVLVGKHIVEDGKLAFQGILRNDPVFVEDYKDGDGVQFEPDEIEEVFEG